MTPEQLQQLIALLSQQMSGMNPSLMASAMPANNVSPANISSVMNPNVLLSSGLVDPSTIQAGIDSVYQQMLADWESRNNASLPYEASDAILAPVTSKYAGTDEVSSFMNEMFTAIKNGTTTADKVKAAIAANDSVAPPSVKAAYANVSVDLDNFGKLAATQATAKTKFQYDQAQKGVTSAPAPSIEQARAKYYKDLGAPEMALLPDMSSTYQFDPSLFADQSRTSGLANIISRTKGATDRANIKDANTQKQTDVYTAKGNVDVAMRAGEKAKQAYLAGHPKNDIGNQIDDWLSRNLQAAAYSDSSTGIPNLVEIGGSILGGIGKLFGEDKTTKRKNDAEKYGQDTMKRVLAQLNKKTIPVSAETTYSPQTRLNATAQAGAANDAAYNQQVADLVAQKLAAKGITPYKNTINQLLGYAATVNQKK